MFLSSAFSYHSYYCYCNYFYLFFYISFIIFISVFIFVLSRHSFSVILQTEEILRSLGIVSNNIARKGDVVSEFYCYHRHVIIFIILEKNVFYFSTKLFINKTNFKIVSISFHFVESINSLIAFCARTNRLFICFSCANESKSLQFISSCLLLLLLSRIKSIF